MKRAKRNPIQRAYHSGFKAGLRGHSRDECPYQEISKRGQWLGGWREGHMQYTAGYRS